MASQSQPREKRDKGPKSPSKKVGKKKNEEKVKALRRRRIDVYLDDEDMKKKWFDYAKKKRGKARRRKWTKDDGTVVKRVPRSMLSKLIVEIVNKAIAEDEGECKTTTPEDLIKENEALVTKNMELEEDLHNAKELARRYDEELKSYRATLTTVPLPLPRPDGGFDYDERLIQVFKTTFPKPLSYKFLEKFYGDKRGPDFMFNQLASLENIEAIRDTGEGYVCVPEIDNILPKPGSVLRTRKVLFRKRADGNWDVIDKEGGDAE